MIYKRLFFILVIGVFTAVACSTDRKENPTGISKVKTNEKQILLLAQKKIDDLGLNEIFIRSKLVIVCLYKKKEILSYDSLGILNFQLNLIPIAFLKGSMKTDKIYIHVHSPGLSGFGHEKNYEKKFLIFLDNDKFEDNHYAEGIDFLRAIMLE